MAPRRISSLVWPRRPPSCPGLLAHARQEYGCTLLARDGAGDMARARQLLEDALGTAEELHMDSLGRKGRAVMPAA